MRGYFQQPRILCPVAGGHLQMGGPHTQPPAAPPTLFRLLPLIRLPPAAIYPQQLALHSFVIQRICASLVRFSFLTRSANAARWAAGGLPVPPPPSLARLVVASLHAPPSLPLPRALRAPVFRLRSLLRNRGLCRPRTPPTSLSPAGFRQLPFGSLYFSKLAPSGLP